MTENENEPTIYAPSEEQLAAEQPPEEELAQVGDVTTPNPYDAEAEEAPAQDDDTIEPTGPVESVEELEDATGDAEAEAEVERS